MSNDTARYRASKSKTCSNNGCRRKVMDIPIPMPYEYQGGKHIILFGWVLHLYRDKRENAATECQQCYLEEMQEQYRTSYDAGYDDAIGNMVDKGYL